MFSGALARSNDTAFTGAVYIYINIDEKERLATCLKHTKSPVYIYDQIARVSPRLFRSFFID